MTEKGNSNCCILCKTKIIDELNYGPLYSERNIAAHLYCLLFAPALCQRGSDTEGFDGFLHNDIRKEASRVKRLRCKFCKETGANLGCCDKTCKYAYHMKCALKNNIIFEFSTKYQTFCEKHKKIKQEDVKKLEPKCGICYDSLKKKYPNAILSPCCKNSWFHKKCMQKFALSSALLFKCPLCGCKETDKWVKLGIFFPIRDASWELEENAFQEFYEPIKLTCEYVKCKDKYLNATEMHMWRLCQFCGAGGIHETCFKGLPNDKYTCTGCNEIFSRPKRNDEESTSSKIVATHQIQNKSNNNKALAKEKPKSEAAFFGESEVSSDDEVWKQGPKKIINMKNMQSKKKKRKVVLEDSDTSDDENEPPNKKIKPKNKNKEPEKQKSLASIMLGESDATDDSDMDCTLIIL